MPVRAQRVFAFPLVDLALLLVAIIAGPASAQNMPTLEREVNSVGVLFRAGDAGTPPLARGSAVTVAPRVMVTERSAIGDSDRLQVYLAGKRLDASLRLCDAHGLCLLDVPRLAAEPVEFGESDELRVGDQVLLAAASDHADAAASLSQGIVTGRRSQGAAIVLEHTAPASGAASGGGVFDASGRLLGVDRVDSNGGRQTVLPAAWIREMGVFGNGVSAVSTRLKRDPSGLKVSPQLEVVGDPQRREEVAGPTLARLPTLRSLIPWLIGIAASVLVLLALLRLFHRPEPERNHRSPMNHDPLPAALARANEELARGQVDAALWDLIKRAEPGNEQKARDLYLQRRARNILSAEARHRLQRSR